jgi:glutathione S-transferase
MIILYGLPVSSYTAKLRVALHWRGLDFEEREPPGGYRSAGWSERVPMATIPALEHDGFFLAESEAILEYLEEAFAPRPLLPAGAQQRARVRMLARLHDLHVEPRVRALFPLIRDAGQRTRLPELQAALHDKLQRLAQAAQAGPYLAGSHPSLADCGFAVTLPLAQRLLQELGQSLVLPARLEAWSQAMAQDSAAQAALAPWRAATEEWLASARSSS